MTAESQWSRGGLDFEPTVWQRFGIEMLASDGAAGATVLSMPMNGLTNPFTGLPTVAPLAVLIDAAAIVSHFCRPDGTWTVTSELALELRPDADTHAVSERDRVVLCRSRALRDDADTSLATCTLTCADTLLGVATVRSYYVSGEQLQPGRPVNTLVRAPTSTLDELMAVRVGPVTEGTTVLFQRPESGVKNDIGVMHGGVAAAGLELAASAAINADRLRLRTGSLRVNFLRPFHAGEDSRYEAAPLRVGRTTAVADAQAIGRDGRAALIARVTAYR